MLNGIKQLTVFKGVDGVLLREIPDGEQICLYSSALSSGVVSRRKNSASLFGTF